MFARQLPTEVLRLDEEGEESEDEEEWDDGDEEE
jgi:hypothetical protein